MLNERKKGEKEIKSIDKMSGCKAPIALTSISREKRDDSIDDEERREKNGKRIESGRERSRLLVECQEGQRKEVITINGRERERERRQE